MIKHSSTESKITVHFYFDFLVENWCHPQKRHQIFSTDGNSRGSCVIKWAYRVVLTLSEQVPHHWHTLWQSGEKATVAFKWVLWWEISTHPNPGHSTRRAAVPRQTRPLWSGCVGRFLHTASRKLSRFVCRASPLPGIYSFPDRQQEKDLKQAFRPQVQGILGIGLKINK